jgi:hypothetical protein
MRAYRSAIILSFLALSSFVSEAGAATYEGGLFFGTTGGASGSANLTVSNLADTHPLRLRLGLCYAAMNPGLADEARRVFINESRGGTPEKHGRLWIVGLDFLYPVTRGSVQRLAAYAGPRYGMFDAHFRYIGDNEEFDVTGRTWGLGAGLEGSAAIGPRFALTLSGGGEYFLPSDLHGHDATYSPDDENVNAREDFGYADADRVINQPELEIRFMGGITYRFGR